MKFLPTAIPGAVLVEPEPACDERGWFARCFCAEEFAVNGLASVLVQASLSYNARAGTLRGLHYQLAETSEHKLIRVVRGRLYDVVVDLRPQSPAFGQWIGVELAADTPTSLYVPAGCAHGFQTLEDGTELLYQMSSCYDPAAQRGVRWDDPDLAVAWPDVDRRVISDRDRTLPLLREITNIAPQARGNGPRPR
ncbi:dTDP-4-dehydrorhamnose 3,5-epimerase [Azospirillum sp. sgz301742]